MRNIIVGAEPILPMSVVEVLPPLLLAEIEECVPSGVYPEEIRLRRGRCASLTIEGKNIRLTGVLDGSAMERMLFRMCEGSIYAHAETLREGYLVLKGGVRVGVCGRACVSDGRVTGIDDLASFCIRLPRVLPPVGEEIVLLLRRFSLTKGVLIFSPPGVGKTTLLRAVAARLAGGEEALRVAVVDTRGELGAFLEGRSLLLDILSGYPRGLGMSIATRTLSAQIIVSDEIGDLTEANEIVHAHIGGVPLLASAHAADLRELLARPGMRRLHEARCFGAYVRLSRQEKEKDYLYDIVDWENADACF